MSQLNRNSTKVKWEKKICKKREKIWNYLNSYKTISC